jgi:hypothetical protein
MALAHAIGSKVEAAYRRGNLMDKRRKLMEEWGAYCLSGVQDFTAKTIRNNITTRGQTCTATNMGDLSE